MRKWLFTKLRSSKFTIFHLLRALNEIYGIKNAFRGNSKQIVLVLNLKLLFTVVIFFVRSVFSSGWQFGGKWYNNEVPSEGWSLLYFQSKHTLLCEMQRRVCLTVKAEFPTNKSFDFLKMVFKMWNMLT